jgi:hypothetical protein
MGRQSLEDPAQDHRHRLRWAEWRFVHIRERLHRRSDCWVVGDYSTDNFRSQVPAVWRWTGGGEKRPVYDRSDPLCCPSAYTYRRLRWNGSRWITRRM